MEKADVAIIIIMVRWFWYDLEIQKEKIHCLVRQTNKHEKSINENKKSIEAMNKIFDAYNRRKEAHTQKVKEYNSRMDNDIELIE